MRILFGLLALLLVAVPTHAAERITPAQVPQAASFSSMRTQYAITIDTVPAGIGRGDWSFAEDELGFHGWWTELDANGHPTVVMEHIYFGGQQYWREQNASRWNVAPAAPHPPSTTSFDALYPLHDIFHSDVTITQMDNVLVRGLPALQYQFALSQPHLPAGVTTAKYDMFLGQNDLLPYKDQWTLGIATDKEPVLMEYIVDIFDHNASIVIEAPPAELVDDLRATAVPRSFLGAKLFPEWLGLHMAGMIEQLVR